MLKSIFPFTSEATDKVFSKENKNESSSPHKKIEIPYFSMEFFGSQHLQRFFKHFWMEILKLQGVLVNHGFAIHGFLDGLKSS